MHITLQVVVPLIFAVLASFLMLKPAETKPVLATYYDLAPHARAEVDCLTQNILFEAGREPEKGKYAVALVTLNRVESPRYPNNICDVVRQRTRHTCQFSWWCIDKLQQKAVYSRYTAAEQRLYDMAQRVALDVYLNYNKLYDVTYGALFYHADYVSPYWKYSLRQTAVIGQHIFYRKP